jgi:hypothetical protein
LSNKKAQANRLCLAQKDGPFALSLSNSVYSIRHEATLLGWLEVMIVALGSSIVTSTDCALSV